MSTEFVLPNLSLDPRSERRSIFSGLEQNPYTVLSVAGARVYHTKLSDKNNQWTDSKWKGKLFFCRDTDNAISTARGPVGEAEKYWFRLADEETGRTVWMFKFTENFEYAIDRPFFHVFNGRVRRPNPSDFPPNDPEIRYRRGNTDFSSTMTKRLVSLGKKSLIKYTVAAVDTQSKNLRCFKSWLVSYAHDQNHPRRGVK